jgi:hypothetical protein
MGQPHQGGELENLTSLVVDSPPGPTTRQLGHSLHDDTPKPIEQQESSSVMVPEPDPTPPTWGAYTQEIPTLDLWNDYPPIKQPNYYLHRSCSICQSAILTLNPFKPLTCHACQQWISTDEDTGSQNEVNEGRDDEEEFRFQDSEEAWCESDERAQGKENNKGDSEEDYLVQ